MAEQDKLSEVLRESDLSGHLPSEKAAVPEPSDQQEGARVAQDDQPCEIPKPLAPLSERIHQLPANPSNSSDEVLAFAFRALSLQLKQSNGTPPSR